MPRIRKSPEVRKKELMDAAYSLFTSYPNGYSKFSVQDITNKAGASKATFFRYFKDKVQLLQELFDKEQTECVDTLNRIRFSEQSAVEKMQLFTDYFFDYLLKKAVIWNPLLEDAKFGKESYDSIRLKFRNSVFLPFFKAVIIQGFEEKTFKIKVDQIDIKAVLVSKTFENIDELLLDIEESSIRNIYVIPSLEMFLSTKKKTFH